MPRLATSLTLEETLYFYKEAGRSEEFLEGFAYAHANGSTAPVPADVCPYPRGRQAMSWCFGYLESHHQRQTL